MYRVTGLGQSSSVDTIAAAIQQQEGYYPGSVAYRNNNPGNLMYAGQPGATPGAGGFAVFDSYQDGYNALVNQINLYAGRGLSISQMTAIYAPATVPGNDPVTYANNIANALGVSPDTSLSDVLAGGSSSLIAFNPGSSLDLSSLALPDLSSIDPTTLAIGALVLGAFVLLVMR